MDSVTKNALIREAEQMFNTTERLNRMALNREIAHYMMPSQELLFGTYGQQYYLGVKPKYAQLSSSTPILMARDLSNAWHTMFSNPTLKFIGVQFGGFSADLNESEVAREWLKTADELVFEKAIVNSNFHIETGKDIMNEVLFGNSATLLEFINGEALFTSVHLANVAFRENHRKKINQAAIRTLMYRSDIIEKFGIDINNTPEVGRISDKEQHNVIMYIYPRGADEIKIDPQTGLALEKHRPFGCIYYLERGNFLLRETGYYENPLVIGRLDQRTGETYGSGIGEIALTDVKKLNKVEELTIKGRETKILPVIFVDSDLDINLNELERLEAGSIIRVPNLQSGSIQEFSSQADTNAQELTIERLERNLKSIFFLDKLELPPRDTVGEQSAYEVQQRLAQMQRFLGGTSMRRLEKLKELYRRAFFNYYRDGMLPPIPTEMQNLGFAIDIVFHSNITRNLDYERIDNMRMYLNTLAEFLNATKSPAMAKEMELNIDYQYIIKEIAIITQLDPKVLFPADIVAQRRQALEQQEQQEAEQQAMIALGQTMGNLGGGKEIAPTMGATGAL